MRFSLEGYELGLAERIPIEQGFTLFTTQAARLARLDAGDIALGRLADLIVLPRDPMALKPADLMNLPVDITIVGGRVVFERGRPSSQQPRRRPRRLSPPTTSVDCLAWLSWRRHRTASDPSPPSPGFSTIRFDASATGSHG